MGEVVCLETHLATLPLCRSTHDHGGDGHGRAHQRGAPDRECEKRIGGHVFIDSVAFRCRPARMDRLWC
jgi:hypothetical protein